MLSVHTQRTYLEKSKLYNTGGKILSDVGFERVFDASYACIILDIACFHTFSLLVLFSPPTPHPFFVISLFHLHLSNFLCSHLLFLYALHTISFTSSSFSPGLLSPSLYPLYKTRLLLTELTLLITSFLGLYCCLEICCTLRHKVISSPSWGICVSFVKLCSASYQTNHNCYIICHADLKAVPNFFCSAKFRLNQKSL